MSKVEIKNHLIEVVTSNINGSEVNSVNSREIYNHLEVGSQYANWIQRAIEKYDFEEGVDFNIFVKPSNNQKDYIVTIDMAKELCMVSNTPKGKETRKYFIAVEKQVNAPMTIDQLLEQNVKFISQLQSQNTVLIEQNKEMKPKALFADSVSQSEQSILIGQFAKLISDDTFTIGQNRLFNWFRTNGYLHTKGQQYNQPLQRYKEQGLFETIERTVNNADGSVRLTITTKITGKGQVYFTNKLKNNGVQV